MCDDIEIIISSILKWFNKDIEDNKIIEETLIDYFGSLWSLEQRMLRCIGHIKAGDSMKMFLKKELFENRPHENSPK